MSYDLYVYKHSDKYASVYIHSTYGTAMTKVLFDRRYKGIRQMPEEVSIELNEELCNCNGFAIFKTEDVLKIVEELEKTALYKTIDQYGIYCTKSELKIAINKLKKACELFKDEELMFFAMSS